jgi:TolB protein
MPILELKENRVDFYLKIKTLIKKGKFGIEANLFNVALNKKILSKKYFVSKEDRYPFLSHKLVVDIAKVLKIEDLGWMQKFIIFAKNESRKNTRIYIADYSLTFKQAIVKNGLNLFPKWRNQEQNEFFYTHIGNTKAVLYKVNLYTGKREKITSSYGMLVCSDVSKDGNKLLLTMAPNDQPDIFLFDLTTRRKARLTTYSGIDVNGNFVDDEKAIIFVSDRLGNPNIFYKKIGEQGVEQMVYRGKNNNFCTTYKNYIAYVSRDTQSEFSDNKFNIYLISTQSDYIRQLTTTGKNLFPRFSSYGDTMLYIKHFKKGSALGIIRLMYNKSYLFPLKLGKLQAIDW